MRRNDHMKTSIRTFGCLVIMALGPASAAHGQDSIGFLGTELLGSRFQAKGLNPCDYSDVELNHVAAHQTVLVLLGDLTARNLNITPQFLNKFSLEGGAILVASGHNDQGRLRFCGTAIDGMVVQQSYHIDLEQDDDANPFQGDSRCPLVNNFPDPRHFLVAGLGFGSGLATNGPSVLVGAKGPQLLSDVARFPNNCWTEVGERLVIPYAPKRILHGEITGKFSTFAQLKDAVYVKAAQAERSRGPIIVAAGEGVFFNGMLLTSEENRRFALNCRDFLLSDGQRRHLLFIRDGREIKSFDIPPPYDAKMPQIPPMPTPTTKLVNKVLFRLQGEGILQRLLSGLMPPQTGWRLFIAVVSIVLVLYAGYRLSKARWRVEAKAPLIVDPLPESAAGPRSMLAQHGAALAEPG